MNDLQRSSMRVHIRRNEDGPILLAHFFHSQLNANSSSNIHSSSIRTLLASESDQNGICMPWLLRPCRLQVVGTPGDHRPGLQNSTNFLDCGPERPVFSSRVGMFSHPVSKCKRPDC